MVLFIVLFGLVLRVINLNQSLWLDEAITVLALKENSLSELITKFAIVDFHPSGYYLLLGLWTQIFGFSEISIRIPSVFFGLVTIYIVYRIALEMFSKKIALFAALFLAVNPLHIYYSQEARMYSLATMVVVLNYLFFVKFYKKDTMLSTIAYLLSLLLVYMVDYVSYLIIFSQLITLILLRPRLAFKYIAVLAASFIIWLGWLPIFLRQLSEGRSGITSIPNWRDVLGGVGLKPVILTYVKFIGGRIDFQSNLMYGLVLLPGGLLTTYLLFKSVVTKNKNLITLLTWIFIPLLIGQIISFFIPIYSYFRFLFILPALVLLIAVGVANNKLRIGNILVVILIFISLFYTSLYYLNPKFQREDWRGLLSFLKQQELNNSEIVFLSNGSFAPYLYYQNDETQGLPALRNFPAASKNDLIDLESKLKDKQRVYYLEYLLEISDPFRVVQKELLNLGFKEANVYNFNGVGFLRLYEKNI